MIAITIMIMIIILLGKTKAHENVNHAVVDCWLWDVRAYEAGW